MRSKTKTPFASSAQASRSKSLFSEAAEKYPNDRQSISVGPSGKERPLAEFYLAINTDCIQFYCFDEPLEGQDNNWSLVSQLDRSVLLAAGDKATAKRLGLKSWTCVRV